MSTNPLSSDLLGVEIEQIINQKISEMADQAIEDQVLEFRQKLIAQKAEVMTHILAKVFELYDRFGQEIIIKIPIEKKP